MAITDHYIIQSDDGFFVQQSQLLAFRYIATSHTEKHLAEEFIKIFDELEVTNKVNCLTSIVYKLKFANN